MNTYIRNKINNKRWIVAVCLLTFLAFSLAFVVEKDCMETASISNFDENNIVVASAVWHAAKYTKRFVAYALKNEAKAFATSSLQLEYLGAVSIIYFFHIIHRIIPVGSKAPPKAGFDF